MNSVDVDVVLATYNGAGYLPEQLDSLMKQNQGFRSILVSDDGSSDETLSIIKDYETRYPDQIRLLPQGPGQGACANFNYLLAAAEASYVFIADQDDVWDSDKMRVCLETMLTLESQCGSETPILVHTDLRVVDQNLNLMASSFFQLQQLNKHRSQFKDLLLQNTVTGCSALVNRALLNEALPIPSTACMHDWWLALVAAAFGKISVVNKATMSYRQHGKNTVGAQGWSIDFILGRLRHLINRSRATALLRPVFLQGSSFLARYDKSMNPRNLQEASDFVAMINLDRYTRLRTALLQGFRKHGILRTAGFYWALFMADFSG